MTEKQKLNQKLWDIANNLRGKMGADEFRDYILGFIFYKYLSEKMLRYANKILEPDKMAYHDINLNTKPGQQYLEAVKENSIDDLGYFLEPGELFGTMVMRGNGNGKAKFILDDLQKVLIDIEQSTMGTDSEEDFENLFEDLDLDSSKLGKTPEDRNEIIVKVMEKLDEVDFELDNPENDVLGDAYEYLIGQFASGAGKKAGEFYTPQEVSSVLAKLVTVGKERLKSVYDPTCGSGSLLLRVAREVDEVGEYFGQESNPTTYNLCRMNMIMHDVHYSRFDIKNEDTLERPQHIDKRFEAVVANPPFSADWSSDPLKMNDDRFSAYGKLAPSNKADLAFLQHMAYQLDDNGIAACILPHGALSRKAGEKVIRSHLIKEMNLIDAVIGLPPNLFYGTDIPTTIVVLKKNRATKSIFFIDASNGFETVKTKNRLRQEDIEGIIELYKSRSNLAKKAKVVNQSEIEEHDFNLNLRRYVDTYNAPNFIESGAIIKKMNELERQGKHLDDEISLNCKKLGIDKPIPNNIILYKKYIIDTLHKVYSGEKRFKNDNGQNYPEWKIKRLNKIAGKVTKKNKDDKFSEVLTNSANQGIVYQKDYFDKDIANQNNLTNYYILEKDDFVYNPRISNAAPVGPIKRNTLGRGVMSPLYRVFRFKENTLQFYQYYFETTLWHRYMHSVANYGARHDRMNITSDDFWDIPIPHPVEDERNKIGNFFHLLFSRLKSIELNPFSENLN